MSGDMVPIVWGRDDGDTFPIRWPVAQDQRCFCYDHRRPDGFAKAAYLAAYEAAFAEVARLRTAIQESYVSNPSAQCDQND